MPNILADTDKAPEALGGILRKLSVVLGVVNWLIESKLEKDGDIRCETQEPLCWSAPIKTFHSGMVLYLANILEHEQPTFWGDTIGVHGIPYSSFGISPSSFGKIMVTFVWFALPILDAIRTKDVFDAFQHLCFSIVTDQPVHCAIGLNDVKQHRGKVLIRLAHGKHRTVVRFTTDEELSCGGSISNGRHRPIDSVRSNIFVPSWDVEDRVGRQDAIT